MACDRHGSRLAGESPVHGPWKEGTCRRRQGCPKKPPTAPQGGGNPKEGAGRGPMRDLKGRYIAPAISAYTPSMVIKLESKIAT